MYILFCFYSTKRRWRLYRYDQDKETMRDKNTVDFRIDIGKFCTKDYYQAKTCLFFWSLVFLFFNVIFIWYLFRTTYIYLLRFYIFHRYRSMIYLKIIVYHYQLEMWSYSNVTHVHIFKLKKTLYTINAALLCIDLRLVFQELQHLWNGSDFRAKLLNIILHFSFRAWN